MRISQGILDNLSFLIVEVGAQVANLHAYLEAASPMVAQRIMDRGGYVHNLEQSIQNGCLGEIARHKEGEVDSLYLRAVASIAMDLDCVTEFCRDCIRQMEYLQEKSCLRAQEYVPLLEALSAGIDMIEPAISGNDIAQALEIGQVEHKLDQGYRRLLKRYTRSLKKKKHTEDLISALFVAHAVEQMGDALLNVSEAIISANLGQPVNTERYHSLKASVEQLEMGDKFTELMVETVAETRSGSGVSGICRIDREDDEGYVAILKDGKKRKLQEELEGVENWHAIYPGLAPKILAYRKKGQSASLLIEHLDGLTLEQILLHEPQRLLNQTIIQLTRTLGDVWRETHTGKQVSARYMHQLTRRLPDVYAVHPDFRQGEIRICGLRKPSLARLLRQAATFESNLYAPFSVYIHGDFNLDNILYDPLEKRIPRALLE